MDEKIEDIEIEISMNTDRFNEQVASVLGAIEQMKSDFNLFNNSLNLDIDNSAFLNAQLQMQLSLGDSTKAIENLKNNILDLQSAGDIDTTSFNQLTTEISNLKAEMQKIVQEVDTFRQSTSDLKNENNELKASLSDVEEKSKNLQNNLKDLSNDMLNLKESNIELKDKLGEVSSENENLKKVIEDLNEETKELGKENENLKKNIEELTEDIEDLEVSVENLSEKTETLESDNKDLAGQLEEVKVKASDTTEALEDVGKVGFSQTISSIGEVGGKLESIGKSISKVSSAASGAVKGLFDETKNAAGEASRITEVGNQYGLAAQEIQKLDYLSIQAGLSQEVLYSSMSKAKDVTNELASGINEGASSAFAELGLNLDGIDPNEQFFAIVESLAGVEDEVLRTNLASQIFGESIGGQIVPLLNTGKEAISEYCAEFATIGALSDEQVAGLSSFDGLLTQLNSQFGGIKLQLGEALLPAFETFATILNDKIVPIIQGAVTWFDGLSEGKKELIVQVLTLVAVLGPVLTTMGSVMTTVSELSDGVSKLSDVFTNLSINPIVVVIGIVAGIFALLFATNEQFRESIMQLVGTLVSSLQPILMMLISILQPITSIFSILAGVIGIIITHVAKLFNQLLPIFNIFTVLVEIVGVFINFALIPLQLFFSALQGPLKIIGSLMGWIGKVFSKFGDFIGGMIDSVLGYVNKILSFIEDKINWVIDKINKLIKGFNKVLKFTGVKISTIEHVSLKISGDTGATKTESEFETTEPPEVLYEEVVIGESQDNNLSQPQIFDPLKDNLNLNNNIIPDPISTDLNQSSGFIYDDLNTMNLNTSQQNNDYSNTQTTQNITVTIQNYAAEVDVDELVNEINLKLVEAM